MTKPVKSALPPIPDVAGMLAQRRPDHALEQAFYLSDEMFARDMRDVFMPEWHFAGHVTDIPEPGDYILFELLEESVILCRDEAGRVHALANVCRHRGSRVCLEQGGKARRFSCPYHAWTYNLDGSLRGAPAMTLNEGFCKEDYTLPKVRCEEWLGWVFVCLDPEAEPVSSQLSEVAQMIEGYNMANYSEAFYEEHVWDTNWKVLAENFMESYHLPVCHAGTIGGLSRLEDMVCPPGHEAFNYHTILKDDSLRIAMAHPDNDRLEGQARRTTFLLAIYPSLMITLTPGYFWYLSLHPKGPDQVHIRFGGGMSNDYANDEDAHKNFEELKTLLDEVNVEDRGCTEKVYRGLCSDAAKPGHLSHLERPNYDFAQYLMSRIEAEGTA